MAVDLTTYPVAKKGNENKLFGYADARQIAKSGGALVLFDADEAEKVAVGKKIEAAKAQEAASAQKAADIAKAGGADASAVKKGPGKDDK